MSWKSCFGHSQYQNCMINRVVYPLKTMLGVIYKLFYKQASFLLLHQVSHQAPVTHLNTLTDAVSLQMMRYFLSCLLHKCLSTNATGQEINMPWISEFVIKTVPISLPTKRKQLKTHAIPKNCPIYIFFSLITKMLLNILQQKLQIYTNWFQQRSVKSLSPRLLAHKIHPSISLLQLFLFCYTLIFKMLIWVEVEQFTAASHELKVMKQRMSKKDKKYIYIKGRYREEERQALFGAECYFCK